MQELSNKTPNLQNHHKFVTEKIKILEGNVIFIA